MRKLFNFIINSIAIMFVIVSCSQDLTIYDTAAQAQFDASATTVTRDEIVNFTDKSIPTKGTQIVSWEWNFDFENTDNKTEFSKEQNPSYAFKKVGAFKVRLVVTDSQNRTSSIIKDITVNIPDNELAHAGFSIPSEKVKIGEEIIFTDNSVPAKGANITKWVWNFGENEQSISNEQHPKWTYTTSGSFTISLNIEDSKGNKSAISKDIIVMDPSSLVNVQWRSSILGNMENTVSPAISLDGSTVYMWANQSATNAYDVALNAYNISDGSLKWSYNVNNEYANLNAGAGVRLVYTSPSIGKNGDIYICARDLKNSGAARKSFLLAITSEGKKRWHYAFGLDANFNYMTPAVDNSGRIYVGHLTTAPYEIAILNPETGAKEKKIDLELGVRSGISVDKNGNVFFCSTGSNGVFSYQSSGNKNWQYNTNFSATGGSISIDSDGTLYTVAAGAGKGLIAAINSNGSKKWEYETPGSIQYGGVVIGADGTTYSSGGMAVIGVESAGVYAFDRNGTLKWHFPTTENVNNCVPLIDNRGYVHFITDSGTYYVVTDEGELYGVKSIGVKSYSSPVMNSDGKVLISVEEENAKSYMICLDTGSKGFANSPWAMKGQNPQRTHFQK